MQRSSCAVTENGSYVAYAPGIPCLLGSALLSIRLNGLVVTSTPGDPCDRHRREWEGDSWQLVRLSGSGSMWSVEERQTALIKLIRARLDATGTAVIVTNLRDGEYETDGRAYLGVKRDVRDIRPEAAMRK